MDPDELEKKVASLITDERCLALVKCAQDARNQAKGKLSEVGNQDLSVLSSVELLFGGRDLKDEKRDPKGSGDEKSRPLVAAGTSEGAAGEQVHGEFGAKRQRESTDGGEVPARATKVSRRTTADGRAPSTVITLPPIVAWATKDETIHTSSSRSSSKSAKEPPAAPTIMRGLSNSQPQASIGSESSPSLETGAQIERTKSNTADIANSSIGNQSSQTERTAQPSSSISGSKTLLGVPSVARAPSVSSDMDIDDDATPSPKKSLSSAQNSVQPLSSSASLLSDASSHPLTPAPTVRVQTSPTSDHINMCSNDVQTTPGTAQFESSVPLDGQINGSPSEPYEKRLSPATLSNSSTVVHDVAQADSSITQLLPQTSANVLPTHESKPQSKGAPSSRSVQEEKYVDSPSSASRGQNSSESEGSTVLETTERNNHSLSAADSTDIGVSEGTIQGSGVQKDQALTPTIPAAVAQTQPLPTVQTQDNDRMDTDESSGRDDGSHVALGATAELPSSSIAASHNAPVAEPAGKSSISPNDANPQKVAGSTLTNGAVSPSVGGPVKTLPGPTRLSSPYLYSAELGKPTPQVFTLTFDVGSESAAAASHWSRRQEQFEYVLDIAPDLALTACSPSAPHVMFRLLCLHTADVEKAAAANPTAAAEDFASAMWGVRTKWPRRGQLLLEINGESDSRGSWIPKQLVRSYGFTHRYHTHSRIRAPKMVLSTSHLTSYPVSTPSASFNSRPRRIAFLLYTPGPHQKTKLRNSRMLRSGSVSPVERDRIYLFPSR